MSEEKKDIVITAQEDAKEDGWNDVIFTGPTVEQQKINDEVQSEIKFGKETSANEADNAKTSFDAATTPNSVIIEPENIVNPGVININDNDSLDQINQKIADATGDTKEDVQNQPVYDAETVDETKYNQVRTDINEFDKKIHEAVAQSQEEKPADIASVFPFASEDDYAHQTNFVGTGNVAYEDSDKGVATVTQPQQDMSEVDIENQKIAEEEAQQAINAPIDEATTVTTETPEVTEQVPKFFAERIKEFAVPTDEEKTNDISGVDLITPEPVEVPEFAPIADLSFPTAETEVKPEEKEDVTITPNPVDLPTIDIQPLETPENADEEHKIKM